jgi:hypothetical protein
MALTYYYDEHGAEKINDYTLVSTDDKYFTAKHYIYGNILYRYDEFLSFQLNAFVNLVDGSGLLIPAVKYTLADGLDLTGMAAITLGQDTQEFSRNKYGDYSALLRLEGKL